MTVTAPNVERMASLEPIAKFFAYDHLPDRLKAVSIPFARLAFEIIETLPSCAERTVALRKLLEAKDCGVRAALHVEPGG